MRRPIISMLAVQALLLGLAGLTTPGASAGCSLPAAPAETAG